MLVQTAKAVSPNKAPATPANQKLKRVLNFKYSLRWLASKEGWTVEGGEYDVD